jgi:phosphatidylinositol-3-phosphatase
MRHGVLAALTALLLAGCTSQAQHRASEPPASGPSLGVSAESASATVPRFAHVVVVIEENHAYSQVIGSSQAPYINSLARSGTLLTDSHGVTHPSEPNYLALFSGSTHGLRDDSCPHSYGSNNLGYQLRAHGMSFAAYSESLPTTGFRGCSFGAYARKHAPWTNFVDLPGSVGKPVSAFPSDYARLPRLSFVVPNLNHDMHDGTVAQADGWLRSHLGGYVAWARLHNSLLVVTWDENDNAAGNHIPSILVGAHARRMHYAQYVDHYRMLATLEAAFGLPRLGLAARRSPIFGVWS